MILKNEKMNCLIWKLFWKNITKKLKLQKFPSTTKLWKKCPPYSVSLSQLICGKYAHVGFFVCLIEEEKESQKLKVIITKLSHKSF